MTFANNKRVWIAAGVMIIVGVLIAANVYRTKALPTPPVAKTLKPIESIDGVGTLEAKEVVILAPKTTSMVQELYADEGDRVKEGQVLARMDVAEVSANVRESTALIAKSRSQRAVQQSVIDDLAAKYDLARVTLERYETLLRGGFVTQAEFDVAQAAARSAKAQWSSARENLALFAHDIERSEAALSAQQEKLNDLTLRAPFEGIVLSRNAEVGSTVSSGAAVFRLANLQTIWVKVYIDEAQSGALRVGQRASVTLRSQKEKRFSGEVARLGVESDRLTEERVVYIRLLTRPDHLHIGEQAEANISLVSQSGSGQ